MSGTSIVPQSPTVSRQTRHTPKNEIETIDSVYPMSPGRDQSSTRPTLQSKKESLSNPCHTHLTNSRLDFPETGITSQDVLLHSLDFQILMILSS